MDSEEYIDMRDIYIRLVNSYDKRNNLEKQIKMTKNRITKRLNVSDRD